MALEKQETENHENNKAIHTDRAIRREPHAARIRANNHRHAGFTQRDHDH